MLALAVTPVRRFFAWRGVQPLRRTFGLFAFGYGCLHFLTWSVLDMGLDGGAIAEDILERPYVMVGSAALLCMLPLAITSTRHWLRRLGKKWIVLHRLAYASGILAVLHYFWLVKKDLTGPLVHAAILSLLLGSRVWWWFRSQRDESNT